MSAPSETTTPVVREARPEELDRLTAAAVRAFLTDPIFNYAGNVQIVREACLLPLIHQLTIALSHCMTLHKATDAKVCASFSASTSKDGCCEEAA